MFYDNVYSEKDIEKDPRIIRFSNIGDRYEVECHGDYCFRKIANLRWDSGSLKYVLSQINNSLDLDHSKFKFPRDIEELSSFLQLETFNLQCELNELGVEVQSSNYEIVPMVHRKKYPNSCLLVSKLKFSFGLSEEIIKMTLPNQIDPKINLIEYHKEALNYSVMYGEKQELESRVWLNLKEMLKYQKLIK